VIAEQQIRSGTEQAFRVGVERERVEKHVGRERQMRRLRLHKRAVPGCCRSIRDSQEMLAQHTKGTTPQRIGRQFRPLSGVRRMLLQKLISRPIGRQIVFE
jgi:hypothetical protein